jgi:hypothetical protein
MDKTGDFHLPWDERSAPVIPKHHCKTSVDIQNTTARQVWMLQSQMGGVATVLSCQVCGQDLKKNHHHHLHQRGQDQQNPDQLNL